MMTAMEAQSPSMPAAPTPAEVSDHFGELAAALDNDPFEIYAELATTAAAFPADHHATMAGALAISDSEAVREAALGFVFSPDPAVSAAALVAISRQGTRWSEITSRLGSGVAARRFVSTPQSRLATKPRRDRDTPITKMPELSAFP
jgi:hypothetical protein